MLLPNFCQDGARGFFWNLLNNNWGLGSSKFSEKQRAWPSKFYWYPHFCSPGHAPWYHTLLLILGWLVYATKLSIYALFELCLTHSFYSKAAFPRARLQFELWHSWYGQVSDFHGTAWNGSIWDCQSVPIGSAFELGSNWNSSRGTVPMGPDRRWTKFLGTTFTPS